MKKIFWILTGVFMISLSAHSQTRDSIHGEIVADTNNIKILKVWGSAEERAYAYGYLLNEQIIDVWENWILLWIGSDYQDARQMIIDGDILLIDSLIRNEAIAAVHGMADAGTDTTDFDAIDFLVLNFSNDLGSFFSKKGFNCSTFMNWGDATVGTDLDGKSVISRHFDNSQWLPAGANNSVVTAYIPSEEGMKAWMNADAAGFIIPWGAGVNQGGISIFLNSMSDLSSNPVPGNVYESNYYLARKIFEADDYNEDGINNTQDVRDAFNENPEGFPKDYIISSMAKWDPASDSLTAMVSEVAPFAPYLTFRTNSYDDLIPGDNLYAANSQIKRNNANNYCTRYMNMVNNMGDGTGIGSQENWDLMANYSHSISGYNYMFCQHIPDLNIFKISTYRNNTQAYLLDPLVIDLGELFNIPPAFASDPVTGATANVEYLYEIEVSDMNQIDTIEITAVTLPDWLSLVDHGDRTATLSGIPDMSVVDTVRIKASDPYGEVIQEFVIDITTGLKENDMQRIHVYPNPANNYITLETDIKGSKELSVFNNNGQIMESFLFDSNKIIINCRDYLPGIYLISLETRKGLITEKLIIL